ncbi:MAG: ABC transporter ATP-binding protein [Rhodospirillaceae bacterium]
MTLTLRDITKRSGAETLIYETSFTMEPGGFNVLLGATNAGKSTLIRIMAGLDRPTTGAVLLDGRDVTQVPTRERGVSLVHQFFVNYPNWSVYDNIASPLRVARMADSEIKQRVGKAAELLKLSPYLDRRPSELSGGQQQRCALARAIVKDSPLVLLDEPLANLDYKLREELRDQLPQLFTDRGAVVVYATSEPSEALMLGGRTAALHEGQVTQFGDTAQVYRSPQDLTTAAVFSDPPLNSAPVTKRGADMLLGAGEGGDAVRWSVPSALSGLADGAYWMGVRPHFVTPTSNDADALSIEGRVQITELSGSESIAHFELEGRSWVSQSHGVHPFMVGENHRFHIDVQGCLYFDQHGQRIAA